MIMKKLQNAIRRLKSQVIPRTTDELFFERKAEDLQECIDAQVLLKLLEEHVTFIDTLLKINAKEPLPQEVDFVHRAVPDVDAELEDEEADDGPTDVAEPGRVDQPVLSKPAVPEQRRVGAHDDRGEEEEDALRAPARDLGLAAPGAQRLERREGGEHPDDRQRDRVGEEVVQAEHEGSFRAELVASGRGRARWRADAPEGVRSGLTM